MCIAVIGGMDRLERKYVNEAEKLGIRLKVYTKAGKDLTSKIKDVDGMIIFTNKVSHRAKIEAMNIAKSKGMPVFMFHSCGICTLRNCLKCMMMDNYQNIRSIKI